MNKHLFPYEWRISDGYPSDNIEYHGAKVFSCFSGGGGSSMGYKLAGYDIIGINEIDRKMVSSYLDNNNVSHLFEMPIQELLLLDKLPEELYDLDILDGSPPCSAFSISGLREKTWGKKRKFREGQSEQILDMLFFDFIELGRRLRPKIMVAENVKGILSGNAIEYVSKILERFDDAGYKCRYKLLNSSLMGVPQRRERVFFTAIESKYADIIGYDDMYQSNPSLSLCFNEQLIPFCFVEKEEDSQRNISDRMYELWEKTVLGNSFSEAHPRGSYFNEVKLSRDAVSNTIRAAGRPYHPSIPRYINDEECKAIGSFPKDYSSSGRDLTYVVGMSVPPVMMAQIAHQIKKQWLDKL